MERRNFLKLLGISPLLPYLDCFKNLTTPECQIYAEGILEPDFFSQPIKEDFNVVYRIGFDKTIYHFSNGILTKIT